MKRVLGFFTGLLLLLAPVGAAQEQPEVSYSDDFQSYGTPKNPPGWIDSSVGNPHPEAKGLYKTWPDPTEGNQGTNIVYGTKQSSGKPEGNSPRIGTFSTLSTHTFSGKGRFEYRGRMIRTDDDTRVGLTFFSSYPDQDRYYLIGLWSQPSSNNLTMQLFGFSAGTIAGTIDSHLTLTPNVWYRFLIQVDDANDATKIRARFWRDGTIEPSEFAIDAVDAAPARLRGGAIGIWSAVRGDAYIDDIFAKSPVDHTAPVIALFESGNPLTDGSKFNRNAVPEIRVTDDLSSFTYTVQLDGAPFTSLTTVTAEGWHTLAVHAVDGPGNVSDLQVRFLVDKTPPAIVILEGTTPFPPGFYFNRDVVANATVTDISQTTVTAVVDGQPYALGSPIGAEGSHTISVTAVDEVGWSTTAGPIPFVIDKTPPTLTFTSHHDGDVITVPHAIIVGGSDDAMTVVVAGSAATVDLNTKVFVSADLPLLEGENSMVATGADRAGNIGTATLKLVVDTRAPELSITAPPANVCIDTSSLQVTGTVSDPRLDSVTVTVGAAAPVVATIDAANGTWSAAIAVDEGKKLITVAAIDRHDHSVSLSRQVVIDRTPPVIEVRNAGEEFTATAINRAVAFFIRAIDADPNVAVSSRLDNNPYSSGTSMGTEGQHTLVVTATDCAGHSINKSIDFIIDLTPPTIRNLTPANGATVGTMPTSIYGTTDTDATSVEVSGTTLRATPATDGTFAIASVPFSEGSNRFRLIATDRAGNSSSLDYVATVKTTAPIVEIRESGLPIPAGALFNRGVTPVIRSVDPQATIAATLNGNTFTSGTSITGDGDYTLRATATDAFGHAGTAEATFTIDRTPPVVDITTPAAGIIQSDHVQVRGTAGGAITATVNGQPVTLGADGAFVLDSLLLEIGDNTVLAIGRDRAGNTGRDEVVVTRDDVGTGIILTYPPDRSLTNRPATEVVGRLLTPGRATFVTIGTTTVPVDPTGGFRINGYALTEGANTITATVVGANGIPTSASTNVTADFTPPTLTILESGQPLTDGVRFAERAVVSLQAADSGGGSVVTELNIDGTKIQTAPFTVTSAGGHSVLAVARDLAGNETRAERTFFIGASSGAVQCQLDSFDPPDGAVILSNKTELVGRSGGAVGVKVNGVAAIVADGAFCATVELPAEGPNTVTIACTDANGNQTGTPETITLQRVTGDPSIAIDTPAEGFVSGQESIVVSGTVGAGVLTADVNGVAASISGLDSTIPRPFTVPSVRLAEGLNTLVAHGRNAGGRVATASRRGLYIKEAPSVSISSPSSNSTIGVPRITVSGTYSNVDPTTLVVSNVTYPAQSPAQFVRFGDTTGSFMADVPLGTGPQTLRVAGRDRLNREASATVIVTMQAGAPSIVITQPANHASFGGGSDSVTVSGTFQAAAGSLVDVNGVAANVTGSSYSASVNFSTLAGGITPIVARVTEPDGPSASATVIVTQVTDAPKVTESFPAPNASEVDRGALLLVLFSQSMEGATTSSAFRLEDSGGAPVSGTSYLDKDVFTFAPAVLLTAGARYTLRVTTAAKNLAGTPLATEYSASFSVGTSAAATAPTVTPLGSAVCGQSITVNGTATPGARVRLESGTLTLNGSADATGKFTFTYPLSGQSGFAVVRVRTVGSDGSVSPAAELKVRIDCNGPQVLNASYDRPVNKLTIVFSEPIDPASATVGSGNAILLTLDDGRTVAGTAVVVQKEVTITPAEDLSAKTVSLTVTTAINDVIGNQLVTPYTQTFTFGSDQPVAGDGSGFISGEVYDATTGRPLPGASITIEVASQTPVTTATDARGRYLARLREGAHTIKAAMTGYTSVWREIIVPAGAGVIPIDIRLTRRGDPETSDGSAIAQTHGGDTTVTKKIDLSVPAGVLASGRKLTLTSVGAQALTGLLPLGWSPIAAAEISVDGSDAIASLPGSQITFNVSAAEVTAAAQNLTAVQYDAARDEWRVIAAVVNVASDGKAPLPIGSTGAYALVYPDKAAGLIAPPLPAAGDVLRGVPAATAPALVRRDFRLDPPIILPSGRAVATLRIEGSGVSFPSGTAVQAYIDEELRLADGSRLLDPPFATDVLLYRTLSGDLGVADFHLAPSARATQVILEIGVDHIRIFPYPGRLDRGTLIGSEGGPVPADDKVAVEIPTGAVPEPLRATATSLTTSDLEAIGAIAGFRILGGFRLTLQRATEPAPTDLNGDGLPDPFPPPELFVPARATFTVEASKLPAPTSQVILAELLDQTSYGRMVRLAVPMMPVDAAQVATPSVRFTTKSIDRSLLPVDGVVHEGRYVVLAAESPIAFATGTVRLGAATGRLLADARVIAPPLGVAEISRDTGIYNIPVAARPAAPFTLVPRHTSTGDGSAYVHAVQIDPDAVVRVDLVLVKQPPVLGPVVVLKGDPPSQGTLTAGTVTRDVALTTNARASFTPSIDPVSVTADSIIVTDAITGARVSGSAAADGAIAVVWTLTAGERLKPNGRYTVAIAATIRGTNGATLAQGATFAFATVTQILNTEIHRERIRITIPDANGVSRIIGEPGALPAGWQAVAVRRNVDFIVRYQTTAASDGSFSFQIGNGGDPADKVTIADLIDLQVVSNIGNLAGIFALTPFASEDGKSFVVPAGKAVRFTTPEGMTLDVPEGAFDVPTVIAVTAARKEDFLDIPALEEENEYAASVRVDFDGVAKKPLRLEAPVPAGFETAGKEFILAEKGMSSRGPRLAVLDLVRVANGKFITDHESTDQSAVVIGGHDLRQGIQRTLTGSSFTKYLQMIMRSGIFMILDIKVPVGGAVGWAAMETLQGQYDLMWDIFASYYIPYIHVFERGGSLLPIITGRQFTVVGIDPGTGLQAFSRTYDPIPFGEPGTVTPIPGAQQNDGGPYPVFGGPFRVEMLDLDVEEVDVRSIRNFNVRLEGGSVRVTPGSPALDDDVKVELLNVSKGTMISGTATGTLELSAEVGNRIVLLIEQRDVDPTSPLSIVFNEPIFLGDSTDPLFVDAALHELIMVEHSPGPRGTAPSFSDITAQVRFTTDSGQRRVNIELPSALQSEALYRITLKSDISDVVGSAPDLTLGQGTIDVDGILQPVGGGNAFHLFFDVRKPAGNLANFSLPGGFIRGMQLSGNLLFLAALDGGLLAYDVSNPAAMGGGAAPIAKVPGPPEGTVSHLSVTIDRHNRVYTTAQLPVAGLFRSYRVEDFANGLPIIPIKASKIINWRLGWSQQIGLPSNTVLSDVPESIPFKIKVILQDDETNFKNREEFIAGTGAQKVTDYPDYDLQKFVVTIPRATSEYRTQRVTIENLSLDMRWSADATDSPAVITNVVARSTDKLRLIRNNRTYAVVAHLGYGIGVYDANAIESNRYAGLFPPNQIREQLVLTAGKIALQCPNDTPDYGIIENYITIDAELRGDKSGDIYAFFTNTYRGVLDLRLKLPSPTSAGTRDDDCEQRNPNTGGLLFQTTPAGFEVPRIKALKDAFTGAAGRAPYGHFGQLARFHWSVTAEQNRLGLRGSEPDKAADRDYLLVAGSEYSLIIVEIDHSPEMGIRFPLLDEHVADVIWVPGGVIGVNVVQSANIALVSDRQGRVVVIDLSRIDERWDEDGNPTSGLFPTARKALSGQSNDPYGVGADDPRILWKSEPGVAAGSVAPVFDPYTGMVFSGAAGNVKVLAALDPRVQMKVNLGALDGLSDVGGIVPLGISPPQEIQNRIDALPGCDGTTLACKENASLGVFRLEVSLPGNMVDSLVMSSNQLQLAVESERVAGAITEQTPNGFPRAHLRRTRRDGSAEFPGREASNFTFTRIVPEELRSALKTQRGYNRFVSPWIVAIADPRASQEYDWRGATKQQKKEAGCEECERPSHLQGKDEDDGIYELYTNGRFIAVRPELLGGDSIFMNTVYSYLGVQNRLLGRFSTIMADTVRPTETLVAAQNPPVAGGALQQTTFLHSGELETNTVDLDAGGRADFSLLFDRSYRSRTIGGSVFGQGWDSTLLKRLRALPNGDVEYRDGAEVWRFRQNPASGYDSPKGLFLKLSRTSRGWKIIDQSWSIYEFDDLGRLLSESDEFFDPQIPDSGNVLRYVYDETGRLSQIIDPVRRASTLKYWTESQAGSPGAYPGMVREIEDWRDRKLNYIYDPVAGTLIRVELPEVTNTSGGRPAVEYKYTPAEGSYSNMLELRSNLLAIIDPHEVAGSRRPRVQFTYDVSGGFRRDHVIRQEWGTGEAASLDYESPTTASTTDALGQVRKYTMTDQPKDSFADRAHALSMVEKSITLSAAPFGELPASIAVGMPATTTADRTSSLTYDGEGQTLTEILAGVRSVSNGYINVQPAAPGFVPGSSTLTPLGGPADPVTESLNYQSGPNRSTFVSGVSANGLTVDDPEPSRNYRDVITSDDSINQTDSFDINGQETKAVSSGGTDAGGAGGSTEISWAGASSAKHERARVTSINDGGVATEIKYPSLGQSVQTDARGVVTTIDYDTWQRPIHVKIVGPDLTMDERFEYDATGRLIRHIRKQGTADVTKTYAYDLIGRPISMTTDNVANAGSVTSSAIYNLTGRTIVTSNPGGSVTTVTLDTLGRVASRVTTTGGTPITDHFAYDLDDNVVFTTDLLTASADAYDARGNLIGSMTADGARTIATVDAWGNPIAIRQTGSGGAVVSESTFEYTPAGRMKSVTTRVDGSRTRTANVAWDGAGRNTGLGVSGRASHAKYDAAGRLEAVEEGTGTVSEVTTTFDGSVIVGQSGRLPQSGSRREKAPGSYELALQYNAAADVISENLGSLEWQNSYDQDGNVTSAKSPNRPARGFEYDSRGALKVEMLPGGATNQYSYHPTGALTSYIDPANEVTASSNDLIGRPTRRTYRDGTEEKIEWEGRRVKSITDRQGRIQIFGYNAKGQIGEITGAAGAVLDRIDYDEAGRIIKWATPDAAVEYADFDLEGRPTKTVQSRLRGGTVIDKYTQQHTWNEHGERISWTMPTYSGFLSSKPWTTTVTQQYDSMGNITKIERTLTGGTASSILFDADYRNTMRPNDRTLTTTTGAKIIREYGYDPANGLVNKMAAIVNGKTIAGSIVTYDGLQKSRARLLGVSGGARSDEWSYDERSRLQSSLLARDADSTPQTEGLTAGDFRDSLDRVPSTPVDPPSVTFEEDPAGGHKISVMKRGLLVEQFRFNGGERREDGRFIYEYDGKGRLVLATLKTTGTLVLPRRVKYFYDGNDRMVGRRLEYVPFLPATSPSELDWKLEERENILAGEALPADTTFVWDPIDDQLVSIYKAGSSENLNIDPNGGLIRQIIHGGLRYDDPLEVAVADSTVSAGVSCLYPIYDEAGSRSLQVILNDRAQIVSRSVAAGPYGEDQAILVGPAVDRVRVTAKKDSSGNVISVDITIRGTEEIAQATVASGFRLAAVNGAGGVVTTGAIASLADEATAKWSLNAAQWAALTAGGGAALSVAATNNARAQVWSAETGFLAAPSWAVGSKGVFSSTDLPVEIRESLASLSQWLASIPPGEEATRTLYEVPTLYSLGIPRVMTDVAQFTGGDPQVLIVSAGFHAQPFQDPFTGKNYVRARWFDPQSGTWMTPDPRGYRDSSNLYAYCGNDPVNCSDPTGEIGEDEDDEDSWGDAAWAFTKAAVKTAAYGVAATVVVTAAVVITGATAPVVITVGAIAIAGGAAYNGYQRYQAGHADSVLEAAAMGLGDVTGINTAIEAVTCEEIGTDKKLSRTECAEKWGTVVGLAASGAVGKRVVKGTVPRARQVRESIRTAVRERLSARPPPRASSLRAARSRPATTGAAARRAPRARKQPPVVLGETMPTRVKPVAKIKAVGAKTFNPRSKIAANWERNQRRWIRKQIKSGREIYDIGLHRGRKGGRSDYYGYEREELIEAGYHREFVKWVTAEVPDRLGNLVRKNFRLYRWVQ